MAVQDNTQAAYDKWHKLYPLPNESKHLPFRAGLPLSLQFIPAACNHCLRAFDGSSGFLAFR